MKPCILSLLLVLAAVTNAAAQEASVRQKAELLSRISSITAGQADIRYYADQDMVQILGKTLVNGTQSGLSSNAAPEPCYPTLMLRFVSFIKPEQFAQRTKDLKAAQAQAQEVALQKVSPAVYPALALMPIVPTTAEGWHAYLNWERAGKAIDDLRTHHWQDHGIVVVRTYLVKPVNAKDPGALAMDALVQKVVALLTEY